VHDVHGPGLLGAAVVGPTVNAAAKASAPPSARVLRRIGAPDRKSVDLYTGLPPPALPRMHPAPSSPRTRRRSAQPQAARRGSPDELTLRAVANRTTTEATAAVTPTAAGGSFSAIPTNAQTAAAA
jgi:hypothetical protein